MALEANAIGTLPTNHTITKMDVAYLRGSGVAFYADTVVFKNTSAPKRRVRERQRVVCLCRPDGKCRIPKHLATPRLRFTCE